MGPPAKTPIGIAIARTAKTLNRAFDRALADAGASQPVWLILMSLKTRPRTQREIAEAVDIREATLTHHLTAMERDGLVVRQRDPANRRVQRVTLTAEGEAAFLRCRDAALAFDRRLRTGVPAERIDGLRELLGTLAANVAAS